MRPPHARAISLLVAAASTVLVSGCGAGGFGTVGSTRPDTSIDEYVALGDGFTSAPYVGSTTSEDGCLRSSDNYPSQVAQALKVTTLADASCVGATTDALSAKFKPPGSKTSVDAQMSAIDRETDLITISIGIEDRGLLEDMFRICLALPCGTKVAPIPLAENIDKSGDRLTAVVRKIQTRAPNAYIVLVGYPQILPPEEPCDKLPSTSAEQLALANILLARLNRRIQSAALETGSNYVNVQSLSQDHHPCADEPWVQGSQSKRGTSVASHPVALEQKAVADAVVARIENR